MVGILSTNVLVFILLSNFRLLSELYSHLYKYKIYKCHHSSSPYFRLLSELYSHLLFLLPSIATLLCISISVSYRSYILTYTDISKMVATVVALQFPSPIGVIFSLMSSKPGVTPEKIIRNFRLLSELYSHLFYLVLLYYTQYYSKISVSYRSYILTYSRL